MRFLLWLINRRLERIERKQDDRRLQRIEHKLDDLLVLIGLTQANPEQIDRLAAQLREARLTLSQSVRDATPHTPKE